MNVNLVVPAGGSFQLMLPQNKFVTFSTPRFPDFMELENIAGYDAHRAMWQSNDLHWKTAEKCQPYVYTSLRRLNGTRVTKVVL